MKDVKILTLKLLKNINLSLVIDIEIRENNSIISMRNRKLNISSTYEGISIDEAQNEFAKFIFEAIIDYSKDNILSKVFESAGIKFRVGIDLVNEISKETIISLKESGALLTYGKNENLFMDGIHLDPLFNIDSLTWNQTSI